MKTIRSIAIVALLSVFVISLSSCYRNAQQKGWHGAGAAKKSKR